MKHRSVLALFALIVAGPALGADLPRRSAEPTLPVAPVALPFSWTGFYAGAQGGYAWGSTGYHLDSGSVSNFHADGGLVGLYAGYNHQFGPAFVAGIMGDLNYSFARGDDQANLGSIDRVRLGFEGALRARVGVTLDHALFYASAGGSLMQNKWQIPSAGYSETKTLGGWTIGAGSEYAVTDTWLVRADYRYTDYGRATYVPPAASLENDRHGELSTNQVTLGVAYKF